VFAALDQLSIAPLIVTGLFYAVLAVVVGVSIVALGGAGIQPLREYWQRALERLEAEAPRIQEEAQKAPERVKQRTEERREQARPAAEE
jgi:predicted Holliday junction resolvase-like endonuclease